MSIRKLQVNLILTFYSSTIYIYRSLVDKLDEVHSSKNNLS